MGKVEVRLYANLRQYCPEVGKDNVLFMSLDNQTKVGDLLAKLKVPKKEISLIMVNGKYEKEDYLLRDGDRVGIFPLIGGG